MERQKCKRQHSIEVEEEKEGGGGEGEGGEGKKRGGMREGMRREGGRRRELGGHTTQLQKLLESSMIKHCCISKRIKT